jgi:hypothetical protein
MLRKNYNRKCSVEKKNIGREYQGVWHQEDLVSDKPPDVSNSDSDSVVSCKGVYEKKDWVSAVEGSRFLTSFTRKRLVKAD